MTLGQEKRGKKAELADGVKGGWGGKMTVWNARRVRHYPFRNYGRRPGFGTQKSTHGGRNDCLSLREKEKEKGGKGRIYGRGEPLSDERRGGGDT